MLLLAALVTSVAQPQSACETTRIELQGHWLALNKYLLAVAGADGGRTRPSNPGPTIVAKIRAADRAGCDWIVRRPEGVGFKPAGSPKGIMVYPRIQEIGQPSMLSTFNP